MNNAVSSALHLSAAQLMLDQARQHLLHLAGMDHPQSVPMQHRVISPKDEHSMLPMILTQVCDLLDASGAALTLLDSTTQEVIVDVHCGDWLSHPAPACHPYTSITPDSVPVVHEHTASIPIASVDNSIGTLSIRRATRLSDSGVRVLSALGTIAANAVHDRLHTLQAQQTTFDMTLEGWVRALELRDHETQEHTRRVTRMTVSLARALHVAPHDLIHIRRGALLHDIGKIAIPDSILLKPGPLTDEEWQVMRQHPRYAYNLLSPIPFLRPALDIPLFHHEKWDGSGYPHALQGEHIPLAARIFAVVDVWDALRFDRPYRKAWSEHKVREHIHRQAGSHFDPAIVTVFLDLLHKQAAVFSLHSEQPTYHHSHFMQAQTCALV